jgi:triosephosphate isomerase
MSKNNKKLLFCNWKMYLNYKESVGLLKKIDKNIKKQKSVKMVVFPSFPVIEKAKEILSKDFEYGAQDVSPFDLGAYTSFISIEMLKQLKCRYIMLGHSETRKYKNEDYKTVNKKITKVLSYNIIPILCIGENAKQRQKGETKKVLEKQLSQTLRDVKFLTDDKLIIAYEPIWAIGTGSYMNPRMAESIIDFIKKRVDYYVDKNIVFSILYGGSVDSKNISEFVGLPNINGVLVGGASVDFNELKKMYFKIKD